MFTALHIKERMNKNPFKPFRIHLSDGSHYDVINHDIALVKREGIEIGINLDDDAIPGKFVTCSMLHINRIENIGSTAPRKRQRKA
jgi:hypothetical protein